MVMASEWGGIGSLEADALADQERAHQAGDAGVDVHDGAAGEVDRAPLEDQAGSARISSSGLRGLLGAVGRSASLGGGIDRSGPAQYQTMCAIGK